MNTAAWLYELGSDQAALWGESAQGLAVVARTGVPVPPTFVISATAVQEFFLQPGLKRSIEKAVEKHGGKSEHLQGVAADIRKAILAAGLPTELKRTLSAYLQELEAYVLTSQGAGMRLVLSSDYGHHVCQYKKIDHITRALQELILPLFTAQNLHQRMHERGVIMPAPKPVVIQAHPEAAASGTAQQYDPQHHDAHVIYMTAHHHEHVRERLSNLDVYRYDRTTLMPLSRQHGKHRWVEKRSGSHDAPTHAAPVLTEAQQLMLARLVRRGQSGFDTPVVMHWALIDDQLVITDVLPLAESTREPSQHTETVERIPLVFGSALNMGVATGRVKIVRTKADVVALQSGDIAVVSHLQGTEMADFHAVRGIISEVGHATSPEAAVAVSLGVPAIGGVASAHRMLTNGQLVTVDANHGVVYEGAIALPPTAVPAHQASFPTTATHVSAIVPDPLHVTPQQLVGFEGIGLLRGEFLLEMAGVHPEQILQQGKGDEYADVLFDLLEQAARAAYPHALRYQLHDVHASSVVGRANRPHRHEPNPKLGYRGAHRLIQEPEFAEIELKVLGALHAKGLTNIEVVLPMVRSVKEVEKLETVIRSLWPENEESPRIWVRCETPALTISAEALCEHNIFGLYLDVPALAQFISGLDGENYQTAHHVDQTDRSLMDAIHYAVATCRVNGVQSALIAEEDEVHAAVIADAVSAGLTEVVISPSELQEVRGLLASIEQRLIIDHVRSEDCA